MPNQEEIISIRERIEMYNSKNELTSPTEFSTVNKTLHFKGIYIIPNSVRNAVARIESGEQLTEPIQRQNKYTQVSPHNKKDKIDPKIVKSRIEHFSKVNEVSDNSNSNDYSYRVPKELTQASKRTGFTSLKNQFENYQNEYQDENWQEDFTSSELNFSQTSSTVSELDSRFTQEDNFNPSESKDITKTTINSLEKTVMQNDINEEYCVIKEYAKLSNYNISGNNNIKNYNDNNTHIIDKTKIEEAIAINDQYLLGRFISDLDVRAILNINGTNNNPLGGIGDSTKVANTTPSNETQFVTFEDNTFVLKTTHLDLDYADKVFLDSLENSHSARSINSETESKSNYQHIQDNTNCKDLNNKNILDMKGQGIVELNVFDRDCENILNNENSLENNKNLFEKESQTDDEQYVEILRQAQSEKNKENLTEQGTQTDLEQHILDTFNNLNGRNLLPSIKAKYFVEQVAEQTQDTKNKENKLLQKNVDDVSPQSEEEINSDYEQCINVNPNLPKNTWKEIPEISLANSGKLNEEETEVNLEQYAEEFENLVAQIQTDDNSEDSLETNEKLFEEDSETELEHYVEEFDHLIDGTRNNINSLKQNDQVFKQKTEVHLMQYINFDDVIDNKCTEVNDYASENISNEAQNIDTSERAELNLEKYVDVFDNLVKQIQQNTVADLDQYVDAFNTIVEEHQKEEDNENESEKLFEQTIESNIEQPLDASNDMLLQEQDKNNNLIVLGKNEQPLIQITNYESKQPISVPFLVKQSELLEQIPHFDLKQYTDDSNISNKQVDFSEKSVKLFEQESEAYSSEYADTLASLNEKIKEAMNNLHLTMKTLKPLGQDTEENLEQYSDTFNQSIKRNQNNESYEDFLERHENLLEQDQKYTDAFNSLPEEIQEKVDDGIPFEQIFEKDKSNEILLEQDRHGELEQSANTYNNLIDKGAKENLEPYRDTFKDLIKQIKNNESYEDFERRHKNLLEQSQNYADTSNGLPEEIQEEVDGGIPFEQTSEMVKSVDINGRVEQVEEVETKMTLEHRLEVTKAFPSVESETNFDQCDGRPNILLEQILLNKPDSTIKDLKRNTGRRWSAGNVDLIKEESKFEKSIKDNYNGKAPRRASVTDLIEEFNKKSNTITINSLEDVSLNATRSRINKDWSGDTKLSVSDKEDSFVEKTDLSSEGYTPTVSVKNLRNIFDNRISENQSVLGAYPKINNLREKIINSNKINYAPKILEDVMEEDEKYSENVVSNAATNNEVTVIEQKCKDEYDSGNILDEQTEYGMDVRNGHNPQEEDLIEFYNGLFEGISNPVFIVTSVYCSFYLIVEILEFCSYIFTLPCP